MSEETAVYTAGEELAYDYEQVAAEHRESVRFAAWNIKRCGKRIVEDYLTIGKHLIGVKELLPHGQFGDWLATEFQTSYTQAERLMNAAKVYGANSTRVLNFNISTVFLMAAPSTPESVREEAERMAKENGAPPTRGEVLKLRDAHQPPKPVGPTVDELTQVITGWMEQRAHALGVRLDDHAGDAIDLLTGLRKEMGWHPYFEALSAVLPKDWRREDVKAALTNVVSRLRHRQQAAEQKRQAQQPKPQPTKDEKPPAPHQHYATDDQIDAALVAYMNRHHRDDLDTQRRLLKGGVEVHDGAVAILAEKGLTIHGAAETMFARKRLLRDLERFMGVKQPEPSAEPPAPPEPIPASANTPAVQVTLSRDLAEKLHATLYVAGVLRYHLGKGELEQLKWALEKALAADKEPVP